MKQQERMRIGNKIRYELYKGEHTLSMCPCGEHSCRAGKCWECLLEELEDIKQETSEVKNE